MTHPTGSLIDKLEALKDDDKCFGKTEVIDSVIAIIRPYMATSKPVSVCPYIVTSSDDFDGGGGTSYCSLAEKQSRPMLVSLKDCAQAMRKTRVLSSDGDVHEVMAKAVLDAAQVKYE